jgi:hypothetical protein
LTSTRLRRSGPATTSTSSSSRFPYRRCYDGRPTITADVVPSGVSAVLNRTLLATWGSAAARRAVGCIALLGRPPHACDRRCGEMPLMISIRTRSRDSAECLRDVPSVGSYLLGSRRCWRAATDVMMRWKRASFLIEARRGSRRNQEVRSSPLRTARSSHSMAFDASPINA